MGDFSSCAWRIVEFLDAHQGTFSAVFSALLVIVGWMQVRVYKRQAKIMQGQEQLQRAWVVAGMGDKHYTERGTNGGPQMFCKPNFHNYGTNASIC